jgi:small subunit ribosomal protein S16
MSVKLRLARVGKTKQPHYRVVAADTKKARNVLRWLNNGALPTERVRKLLEVNGLWGEFIATKSTKKK